MKRISPQEPARKGFRSRRLTIPTSSKLAFFERSQPLSKSRCPDDILVERARSFFPVSSRSAAMTEAIARYFWFCPKVALSRIRSDVPKIHRDKSRPFSSSWLKTTGSSIERPAKAEPETVRATLKVKTRAASRPKFFMTKFSAPGLSERNRNQRFSQPATRPPSK